MKKKTTNPLLIVLFSLFVISCPHSFDPPRGEQLPEGCGSFTMYLADYPERTIMPSTPELKDLAVIKLVFTPTPDNPALAVTVDRYPPASGNVLSPVILAAGTYDLTVSAYKDSGKTRLAAIKSVTGIVITSGANINAAINLTAIFSGGTGTFKWDITLNTAPITVSSATMTIKDSDGVQKGAAVNLLSAHTGNRELDSGSYTVVFELTGNDHRTVVWNEILHVYSALDSEFKFTFSDEYFTRTHWDVTFDRNYLYGGSGIQSFLHGDKAGKPTNPNRNGFDFDDWYTESTCDNKYNFDDNVITGNITLYARWIAQQVVKFEFKITDNMPVVDSGITIYKSNIVGGGPTTATLKVNDAGGYAITWSFNGIPLGTGASVTLDSADDKFNNISGHKFITVEAEKDGVRYSKLVIITVQLPQARIGETLYGTLWQAISDAPGNTSLDHPAEIVLLQNVTTTGKYAISNYKHIRLSVDTDRNLTINATTNAADGNFPLFEVNANSSLTLDGADGSLTLNGGGVYGSSRRGIYIYDKGTVVVNDNVIIAGFKCTGAGGGVYVAGGTASFTMNGGTIYGNDARVPEPQRNTASSIGASIYVSGGTAKYGGRYGNGGIFTSENTLPSLSGDISISPNSITTYTRLNAVYTGSETVSYQWSRGTDSDSAFTTITDETNPTYIPATSGYYRVTVSAPGYTGKTSSAVYVDYSYFNGTIIINPAGKVEPSTPLTAAYNGNEPILNDLTVNYRWYKDSGSISNATASTYTPTDPGIYYTTISATGFSSKTGNTAAFITTNTVAPLAENNWSDGELTTTNPQDWYSFNVTAGKTYRVWLNSRDISYGDGTKTGYLCSVSAVYSDGTIIVLDERYSWLTSYTIQFTPTTASSDKVYIQVKPYNTSNSYLGTYGIVYSSGSTRPINNTLDLPGKARVPLTANTWKQNTLSSTDTEHWYSFSVTKDTTYYLWWNERNSYLSTTTISNQTAANIDVAAWYDDGSEAFSIIDTAWTSPKSFKAEASGTVTLHVRTLSASTSYYGVYEIVYSTSNTRPDGYHKDWTAPSGYITPLTNNIWASGNITSTTQEIWYSFTVTSGTTYRIWLNDVSDGDGTKTGRIRGNACYSTGETIYSDHTSGYGTYSYRSFTAASNGTVYFQVKPYSASTTYLGTFGIVCTNGTTRP